MSHTSVKKSRFYDWRSLIYFSGMVTSLNFKIYTHTEINELFRRRLLLEDYGWIEWRTYSYFIEQSRKLSNYPQMTSYTYDVFNRCRVSWDQFTLLLFLVKDSAQLNNTQFNHQAIFGRSPPSYNFIPFRVILWKCGDSENRYWRERELKLAEARVINHSAYFLKSRIFSIYPSCRGTFVVYITLACFVLVLTLLRNIPFFHIRNG